MARGPGQVRILALWNTLCAPGSMRQGHQQQLHGSCDAQPQGPQDAW